jgi:CRP/FNR family transcriptional regulator
MNIENSDCLNCGLKSNIVSVLNRNELCILGEGCLKITYKKGETIFKEGTPSQSIAFIRSGFIKLSKKGIGGKDNILSVSKKGAYLGIQNLNKKSKVNYFSAIALTDSEVCFIETECFGNLLKQNGTFATEIISYIFNDEMNYFDRLLNNLQQQLPGRLANALIYFGQKVYNQNPFNLNLTKTELGSLIGTSRESVTRLLKDFQDAGIIKMGKNEITILNEKKLEEIKLKG